ncbi:MAG TPA: homoserine O-acetyltransferase [Flavitalea sp.]|nr:homoserine O-acetyltransferase [Flavitalea sp.]
MQYFSYDKDFRLESGEIIKGLTVAYHTYGSLNSDGSNVVWICHHLTANSDASLWWQGMVGQDLLIDPAEHYIVCANILGSCYGTTGPLSVNPVTGSPYYQHFPFITIRDMVNAHILLRVHLKIETIQLLIGGSMGGYQALEWAAMEPKRIGRMILLSTSAAESAWGIAVHTAQRMAIEADNSWNTNSPEAGKQGLKAARAIGLISYRNHKILVEKQTDENPDKMDGFQASSYMVYQGDKLASRFNAFSYWILTKAMDSHNLARGRAANTIAVLNAMIQPTLVFGIQSDILCPLPEQEFLLKHLKDAVMVVIDSDYGHDGFMVESKKISSHIRKWWRS